MGGSVGNTLGRIGSGVFTLGGSEIARNNLPKSNPIRNAMGIPGTIFSGGLAAEDQMPWVFNNGQQNPYVSGPFSLDPNQVSADISSINAQGEKQYDAATALGDKQYQDLLSGIDTNGTAQTQRARDLFTQMLPDIAENAQAAHLYDSSGYGQEVARQQANIASQVASEQANQRLAALQGRQGTQTSALQGLQGFQTGGLQRGLSLEDFINQANVSKTLGQAFAPQAPTGKQNFGTVASGVGALAPMAKAMAK